jgi:hypothetical protein
MERSFDLHMTAAGGAGSFLVYAESETQGQADAVFTLEAATERPTILRDLTAAPANLEALGTALYRAVLGGSVGALFNLALGEVLADEQGTLRLRLRIDPPKLALVPWELTYDPDRGRFLSAWSKTLVSRSFGLLEPIRPLAVDGELRMLAVFPRSSGLSTASEKRVLENLASATAGRIAVRRPDELVTLEALRTALRQEEVHILHYAGHGTFHENQAAIYLDHPRGEGAQPIAAAAFAQLLQANRSLRLVVLNSCQGASRSSAVALAGMAPQLLRHGVTAVVAMQGSIRNERALTFASELYRELVAGNGHVERAVTAARSALLQEEPDNPDFADPVLYLRGPDGCLWKPGESPIHSGAGVSLRRGALRLPPPPSSFLGRADHLRALKARLCRSARDGAERAPLVLVTGWPGIGKTTMTTALANDPELREAFPDGILWACLDQSPNLLAEISAWCIALGSPGPSPSATIEEASLQLGHLVRGRRVLLLLDDVWETAHAVAFLVGGQGCAMLATSRLDAVANDLAQTSAAVYRLPLLSEEAGLELLSSRAPEVVAQFPEECRVLVRELEGLPLTLHVAGRMLAGENKLWNPGELMETLREGRQLLGQRAPSDRTDLRSQALPTLSVLLSKSTERLPSPLAERFAYLGLFAPKPATFDLAALRAVWEDEDPKPSVRSLVNLGLLEPLGDGRFRMHSLLVAHARSLLDS